MSMYFGGTIVGARSKEGVVLAADQRMSYGYFVASRNARKIYEVNNRVAIAFAGLVGDMGGLMRFLETDLKTYSLTTGVEPSVYMVAKRLSIVLYSYKIMPFIVEALVGGADPDGKPRLYALDSLGSVTEEDFASAGSGATLAYGYLEANYREDLGLDELEKLVEEAMMIVLRRDASTGDGVRIVSIGPKGVVRRKTLRLRITEASE